jgi:hypothetical protein
MTGQPGGPHVDHLLRASSGRKWWAAYDRPGFWFLASAVFAGNGLLSAWQHNWWLAIMQFGTAMLAVTASFVTSAAHQGRGRPTIETGRSAEPKHRGPIDDAGGVPPDRG